MPQLAGNLREHLSVLSVDAEEVPVFERDAAIRVAQVCIWFKIGFKELTPTKGGQISNVHDDFSNEDAATDHQSATSDLSACDGELRVGELLSNHRRGRDCSRS